MNWESPEITALIHAALDEDLGPAESPHRRGDSDATTVAVVPQYEPAQATLLARRELVLAGLPLAERIFRELDPSIRFREKFQDGQDVPAGAVVAELKGRARAILTAERTALNFLARLSGIASETRRYVSAIAGTRARIRDTRKTTPLLRALEKYAVVAGGGANHRFGLFDAVLIKENHIAVAGSVAAALRRAQSVSAAGNSVLPVQIEVRNEAELNEALAAGAAAVLLDNVSPAEAERLVRLVRSKSAECVVEVSGGVTLASVRACAESGCDFIAVGALTHSAPAADFSLLFEPRA